MTGRTPSCRHRLVPCRSCWTSGEIDLESCIRTVDMVERWLESFECKEPLLKGSPRPLCCLSKGVLSAPYFNHCSVASLCHKWEGPKMLGGVGEAYIHHSPLITSLHLGKCNIELNSSSFSAGDHYWMCVQESQQLERGLSEACGIFLARNMVAAMEGGQLNGYDPPSAGKSATHTQ